MRETDSEQTFSTNKYLLSCVKSKIPLISKLQVVPLIVRHLPGSKGLKCEKYMNFRIDNTIATSVITARKESKEVPGKHISRIDNSGCEGWLP